MVVKKKLGWKNDKIKPGKGNRELYKLAKPYQFVKGQVPNPTGRPKGIKSFARLYKMQLEEPASLIPEIAERALALGVDPETTNVGSVLALAMISDTVAGRTSAYAGFIINRMDNLAANSLNKAQLIRLARSIVEVICSEVPDPQTRASISERIVELIDKQKLDDDDDGSGS